MSSQPTKFRALLDQDELISIPAAFNALSARLVQEAGFKCVLMGGQVLTVSTKALPDYGYLNLTDMVNACRAVASATNLCMFVDADTGYGNAVNIVHTVHELEAAGAAGLFIEDQESPPRCGNVAGRQLISTEEMMGKVSAAMDARSSDDFIICARTDARGVYGPDEAIARATAYAKAGAEMTFVDGALSVDELKQFAEIESRYRLVNLGGAGKKRTTPRPPLADLEAMGYDVALFALNCMRAAVNGLWNYLIDLQARGSEADLDFILSMRETPFESWYEYTGYSKVRELEEKYLPAEEVERRYAMAQEGYYTPGAQAAAQNSD